MQSVAEEQVNISICHIVDHEVTNWDKVASFVDSEMKDLVPTCIRYFGKCTSIQLYKLHIYLHLLSVGYK